MGHNRISGFVYANVPRSFVTAPRFVRRCRTGIEVKRIRRLGADFHEIGAAPTARFAALDTIAPTRPLLCGAYTDAHHGVDAPPLMALMDEKFAERCLVFCY